MNYLTAQEARAFAEKWLPAWSGNNPELLAGFYSDDAGPGGRSFFAMPPRWLIPLVAWEDIRPFA